MKLKHLEFIQNIITRINSNSFMIKGWAVTLISAILIFADKSNNKDYLMVPLLATIFFFILDAYYLCVWRSNIEHYMIKLSQRVKT
jgi:hypothetical protein